MTTFIELASVLADKDIDAKFSFSIIIGPNLAKGVVSIVHAVPEDLPDWGLEGFAIWEWKVQTVLYVHFQLAGVLSNDDVDAEFALVVVVGPKLTKNLVQWWKGVWHGPPAVGGDFSGRFTQSLAVLERRGRKDAKITYIVAPIKNVSCGSGAADTTTLIGTIDTNFVLESFQVIDACQDMVGICAFPVRIAATSWLWAPGVLTPILAGNTARVAGCGDGDIGSGVGCLSVEFLDSALELDEATIGAIGDGPRHGNDFVAWDWAWCGEDLGLEERSVIDV
ncbi:hypothetical protein E6O75_ATG07244 [Venturia nashicola]|uniref:Uncharacterized protein n=1 Tax=Venturia nashicola TaxID=86259 RepID=A0A4Z1NZ42_9PEZI|nr:hypothetical protein E6O75_ATG07244 [Venturia nashicola]